MQLPLSLTPSHSKVNKTSNQVIHKVKLNKSDLLMPFGPSVQGSTVIGWLVWVYLQTNQSGMRSRVISWYIGLGLWVGIHNGGVQGGAVGG